MIKDLFAMIEQTPGENSIKPDSQAQTVAEILRLFESFNEKTRIES